MQSPRKIYLDYNATAPLLPEVLETMSTFLQTHYNASAMHSMGQKGRQIITKARQQLADFIIADPEYIIFTSGGTEANNQALRAAPWDNVIMSSIEHDCVYKAIEHPHIIPVDQDGLIDMAALESTLKRLEGQRTLVSVIWGNNETGVIQPMETIVQCAKKYGAFTHTDATQVIGKHPIDFAQSGLDMMTITAHKFGGPQGVGALIVRETVPLSSFMRGGGQEKNRRSGTENIAAIAGFGVAAVHAPDIQYLARWHRLFEKNIQEISNRQTLILSEKAPRLCNTSYITMPDLVNNTQVMAFDLAGILVSAGSACSSGRVKISRVAQALTRDDVIASTAVRFTSGWATKAQDFEFTAQVWKHLFYQNNHKKEVSA